MRKQFLSLWVAMLTLSICSSSLSAQSQAPYVLMEEKSEEKEKEILTWIYMATYTGKIDLVEKAIKLHPASLKKANKYGNTPLHLAAYNGYQGIVKYFTFLLIGCRSTIKLTIQNCLDFINQKNHQGLTASDYARANNHEEIVQLLKETEVLLRETEVLLKQQPKLKQIKKPQSKKQKRSPKRKRRKI